MNEHLPRDWTGKPVDRPLLDDLADVLAKTVVGWEDKLGIDLATAPEVLRVMARYRQFKENRSQLVAQLVAEYKRTGSYTQTTIVHDDEA